jgi:hypothetical protein
MRFLADENVPRLVISADVPIRLSTRDTAPASTRSVS